MLAVYRQYIKDGSEALFQKSIAALAADRTLTEARAGVEVGVELGLGLGFGLGFRLGLG